MSAGRFKSKDDYFSHRSGLAERVIAAKPQPQSQAKPGRRRGVENAVPVPLLRVHFCKTVESFEIVGKGHFHKGEYPLDDALQSHLDGDTTLLVNPLSIAGDTAFTVVRFDLSEEMDHPFSKARQYADELQKYGIFSLIEVTEGGKGHYHLWIFHEQPIPAVPFSDALVRLGHRLFGVFLETVPPVSGDISIPLPLQGESVLLQRRVFVNAVGKMIKEQGSVLQDIEYCPKQIGEDFIERMHSFPKPLPSPRPAVPNIGRRPVPPVAVQPTIAASASVQQAPAQAPTVSAAPSPTPDMPSKTVSEVEKPKPSTPAVPESPVLELIFPEISHTAAVSPASPAPVKPAETVAEEPVLFTIDASVSVEAGELAISEPVSVPTETHAVEKPEEIESRKIPEPVEGITTESVESPVCPAASPEIVEEIPAPPEDAVTAESAVVEAATAPRPLAVFVYLRNGKEYGIPVDLVDVVAAAGGISPLSVAGKYVRGTMTVSGRTVTVLDIGLSAEGTSLLSRRAKIIILNARAGEIGLLADSVSGMVALSGEGVAPSIGDECIQGVAEFPEKGRSILLPDMERLVTLAKGKPYRPEEKAKAYISPEPHVFFTGGGGRYALPARAVREILPDTQAVLHVDPGKGQSRNQKSPESGKPEKTVLYRGQTLPVIEIPTPVSPSFGNGAGKTAPRGRILVLRTDEALFGMRVDAIAGIRSLSSGDAEQVAGSLAPIAAIVHVSGQDEPVQVLDPEQVGKLGIQSV